MIKNAYELADAIKRNNLEILQKFFAQEKNVQHARIALGALALTTDIKTQAREHLRKNIAKLTNGIARLETEENFDGIELLPGCARQFTKRALKVRGYSVAIWLHRTPKVGRFELFALGGGALRIEIDASEQRWRVEVFAKGRLRGSGACSRRRLWSNQNDDDNEIGTLIVASQGAKYLSQAQVVVHIKDGPQLSTSTHTFSAAMPALEESELSFSKSQNNATEQLRPSALRCLRGFQGSFRSIAVFDGVVSVQGVNRLWTEDWKSTLCESPPPRQPHGEKQLSILQKSVRTTEELPSVLMALIPRCHDMKLWLPRCGGKDGEFADASLLLLPRINTDRIKRHNSTFVSGSEYKVALAAVGGITIAIGAGADCEMVATLLINCGRSQIQETLQSRALFALAAKADWTATQALALIDAASSVAGPGSGIHAAALEAFFCHAAAKMNTIAQDSELLRGAAERAAPALLCEIPSQQSEDDGLARALRLGIGLDRIITLANGPISTISSEKTEFNTIDFERAAVALDSLRLCAAVIISNELQSENAYYIPETQEEAALAAVAEPSPKLLQVTALLDAVHTGSGVMRCVLLEALALATSRAPARRRAAVALLLQRIGFAERIVPQLMHMTEQQFPPLPRNCHLFFPAEATATLASSAMRLALWQHHCTDIALRAAVSASCAKFSVNEGGETSSQRRIVNEKIIARRTFRRFAARAATSLATELDASITRSNNKSQAASIAAKALLGGFSQEEEHEISSEAAINHDICHPLARSLPSPPLWLALPLLAVICPRLENLVAEQYVAAACAKLKSHRITLEALVDLGNLDYALKSLLELAWRCRDTLIELLTIDAIAALLLTRSLTNGYELDHAALARLADPKFISWSGNINQGKLWQKRAMAALAASLSRRLAADVGTNEASAAGCLAAVLDLVLEKLLPPVPKASIKSNGPLPSCPLGLERGADLAHAVADAARALRRTTDIRRRGTKEENESKQLRPSLFQRGRKSVADAARRTLSELTDLSAEERGSVAADIRMSRSSVSGINSAVMSAAAANSLLALRRCGRTIARAVSARLDDDPAALAQLVVELRACIALGIDIADDVVAAGTPSAAVVACDDTLHALACLAAELNNPRPDIDMSKEMRRVVETAVLGLIRDSLHQAGGGVATACARAALHPAANIHNARDALYTLNSQLESALAQDEEDADAYVSANQPFRHSVDFEKDNSHLIAAEKSSEAIIDDFATRQRKIAAARRDDRLVASSAALLAKIALDARYELNVESEDDGQRYWELNDGNALTVPSLVAVRSEVVDEPLKPHDDGEDSSSYIIPSTDLNHDKVAASLVASGVAPLLSSREDELDDLAPPPTTLSVDDEVLSDAPPTDTEEPPRGILLRNFRGADEFDDHRSLSPPTLSDASGAKLSSSPPKPLRVVSRGGIDITDNVSGMDSSDSSSLGPTEGPFPRGGTAEAYMIRHVTRIQRHGNISGMLCVTRSRKWLVFRPEDKSRNCAWRFRDVAAILIRRHRLRDTALELYFRRGLSVLIDCIPSDKMTEKKVTIKNKIDEFTDDEEDNEEEEEDEEEDLHILGTKRRDELLKILIAATRHCSPRFSARLDFLPLLQSSSKTHPSRLLRRITRAWQERRLSNYEYLLFLNALSGRSFADPCSYPVFPWTLANYTSETLDLEDKSNYRDLSKPMGALNQARLRDTIARYETFIDPHVPPFHYGSLYSSSAGVVMHYLLRLTSFAKLHCELQGGKFDVADRLFASIPEAWESNSGARGTSSGGEVKELTPEWYSTPAFLVNRGNLPLGSSQEGDIIGDVELPPWARGSPYAFIAANRNALESEIVSNSLHHWIDLIFGYKQRGQAAIDSHNVFFYLCYADAIDLDQIDDKKLRASTVLQASQFGQVPTQLISRTPHPPRGTPIARYASPRHIMTIEADLPLTFVRSNVIGLADDAFLSSSPISNSSGDLSVQHHGDDSLAIVPSISCVAIAAFETQRALESYYDLPKARPLVALRSTIGRAVGVDDQGQICIFAWGFDKAAENTDAAGENADISLSGAIPPPENNDDIRRAALRPLPLYPFVEESLPPIQIEPLTVYNESLSPRLVSISADCRFVAAADPHCPGCVRLVELSTTESAGRESAERLERLCAVIHGEASIPAAQCELSLVTFAERDPDEWDDDSDPRPHGMMLIVGVVNGTASIWRIDRAQDLPGLGQRVLKRKSIAGRRPELVARGHSAAIVAADASTALGILVTAAADGAILLHDLNEPRAGMLLRRLRKSQLEPETNCIISMTLGRRRGIVAIVAADADSVEILSLNGGPVVTGMCLKGITPFSIRFAGENDSGLLVVSKSNLELRSVDRGLTIVTSLSPADIILPQALATPPGRITTNLCVAELAPDTCRPAALFVATSEGSVALRVLAGSEHWYERKANQEASVSAALAKTATNVIGLVAGAAAKTHEIATVTRGVVQEAASTSSFRAISKFLTSSSTASNSSTFNSSSNVN